MATILSQAEFNARFAAALQTSTYQPHHQYSVFTQYDGPSYYAPRREDFQHKYRIFAAVTRVLQPEHVLELGTHAASGAHAYLHGAPAARYSGYDVFGSGNISQYDGEPWQPLKVAHALLQDIGATFELFQTDLRQLKTLPAADFVVVDAAHDFTNAYEDCLLALTAKPQYIWVDDYNSAEVAHAVGEAGKQADYEWWQRIDYIDCGLLIKLK